MGIAVFHAEGNCQGPLCPQSMTNSNLFYLLSQFTIQKSAYRKEINPLKMFVQIVLCG